LDRLEAMSVLIAAAETGSLSKASRKLGQPLATVSRKVADLESHLKASLLTRSAKGLELTDAGRSYVAAAKSILEQVSEAERAASGEYSEPKGQLTVTAPAMFGRLHVLPVVTEFLAAFPNVSVGLMLMDRIAHFQDDQVDIALRIGALPDSALIATRLGSIRRVMCASPTYLKAQGEPKTLGDLADHHVISFDSAPGPTNWTFCQNGKDTVAEIRPRLGVTTIEAAIDAGLAGAGLARVMSYQVAEHVGAGKLKVVLKDFEHPPAPVHLVHDKTGRLPVKLRAFLDFAIPRLRKRLNVIAL
jgi:DNA-binding transcriptional LysR family regulator